MGRLKKPWVKGIEEDICKCNLVEEYVYDRVRWRVLITSQTY